MRIEELAATARALMAPGKGLLAMDESGPTCNKRFEALGIPTTPVMRRDYRELILSTPGLKDAISGVIFYDETFAQSKEDGGLLRTLALDAGLIPGIKVDAGAVDMALHPGEKITEGLDGLRARLAAYRAQGARFAKWRAVISIGPQTPSRGNLRANAHGLARYAALCQEAGLVPIVEPEVLMDGSHDLMRCYWVTEKALHTVFEELYAQRVDLKGILLKPNMVLPGKACSEQPSVDAVAEATVNCLLGAVPAAVPGVAFLSGGQPYDLATQRLQSMHRQFKGRLPWALTFSFSRAIQEPALALWKGDNSRKSEAQKALLGRAKANAAALGG